MESKRIAWNKGLTKENDKRVKGCKHTKETKIRLSLVHKGKKFSEEHRRNLSKNHWSKKEGYISPNKDKKLLKETKEKISKSCKGKISYKKGKTYNEYFGFKKSKILKNKISKALKGKKCSEETKQKLRIYYKNNPIWNKGKHTGYKTHTKESIRKMLSYKEKRSFPEKLLFNRINGIYKNISIIEKNKLISDKDFNFRAKPDILIDKFNLIVEYDGLHFHNNLQRDIDRDKKLINLGYKVIHYRGYTPDVFDIINDVNYMLENETKGLYKEKGNIILNIV
jgi:hypothetical protein